MSCDDKLMTLTATKSGNVTLSASNVSTDISALKDASSFHSIRLTADIDCNVSMTTGAGTASATTDLLLRGGAIEIFNIPDDATHLNAIAGGAGSLNYTITKGA